MIIEPKQWAAMGRAANEDGFGEKYELEDALGFVINMASSIISNEGWGYTLHEGIEDAIAKIIWDADDPDFRECLAILALYGAPPPQLGLVTWVVENCLLDNYECLKNALHDTHVARSLPALRARAIDARQRSMTLLKWTLLRFVRDEVTLIEVARIFKDEEYSEMLESHISANREIRRLEEERALRN